MVVIGILIALQINTWIEQRKEAVLEFELLEGFLDDITTNESRLKTKISQDSAVFVSNETFPPTILSIPIIIGSNWLYSN